MARDSGPMRQVIRFEQRSTTQDAAGEPVNTWTTFATRRAEKLQTPGRELWASNERQGRVPTLFRLRALFVDGARVDLGRLPAMRLICNDKVFNVLSAIDPDGMGADLVISTEELVEAAQ